jgi:cellobiose-specific phosphotransferase system component IIC
MNNWIDKKGLITGIVTGIVLFLLYKHFVRETTGANGVKKLEVVPPGK